MTLQEVQDEPTLIHIEQEVCMNNNAKDEIEAIEEIQPESKEGVSAVYPIKKDIFRR